MIKKVYDLYPNFSYKWVDLKECDTDRAEPDGINSLKDRWGEFRNMHSPTKVGKTVKDYTNLCSIEPIFSAKAVEILKEFFTCGELLPIKNEKGKDFFMYNFFPKVDYIDWYKSNILWYGEGDISKKTISHVFFYYFIPEKIHHHIFINNKDYGVFVTDIFVQKVIENNLKGFSFVPLWDIETGGIEYFRDKEKNPRIIT
ncbi:MAG: hypothetical protein U0457_02010 [Candidatus Sericytochromatia bacterium]